MPAKLLSAAEREMRSLVRIIKASNANFIKRDPLFEKVEKTDIIEETDFLDEKPAVKTAELSSEPAAPTEAVKAACDDLIATATEEANLRLRDADNQAAELLARAKAEADELLHQAKEDGYSEGTEQARAATEDMLQQVQDGLQEIIDAAERQRDEKLALLEEEVVRLAFNVAEKILALELDRNDGAFIAMIKNALDSVRTEKIVTMRVNPEDYLRFFDNGKKPVIASANGSVEAKVLGDDTLNPYDVLIESDSGDIDAGLDQQVEQLRRSLEVE
jgi:flagellar assembly protein FliH